MKFRVKECRVHLALGGAFCAWLVKRKRALPEGNPPGIASRKLIVPMRPGRSSTGRPGIGGEYIGR